LPKGEGEGANANAYIHGGKGEEKRDLESVETQHAISIPGGVSSPQKSQKEKGSNSGAKKPEGRRWPRRKTETSASSSHEMLTGGTGSRGGTLRGKKTKRRGREKSASLP